MAGQGARLLCLAGALLSEEVKKIRGSGYINGTFLKMAAESIKEKPLGGYKLD